MELLFREAAKSHIASFVSHYEEGFFALYRDTGLWSEEMIIEGVRANGRKLFEDFYNTIESQLSRTLILGRKKLKKGWYEIDFHVGSRLVVVHYSEEVKKRIRWAVYRCPPQTGGPNLSRSTASRLSFNSDPSVGIGEQTRQIAVIVLGSRDAQADVLRLLNFVHSSYAPARSGGVAHK